MPAPVRPSRDRMVGLAVEEDPATGVDMRIACKGARFRIKVRPAYSLTPWLRGAWPIRPCATPAPMAEAPAARRIGCPSRRARLLKRGFESSAVEAGSRQCRYAVHPATRCTGHQELVGQDAGLPAPVPVRSRRVKPPHRHPPPPTARRGVSSTVPAVRLTPRHREPARRSLHWPPPPPGPATGHMRPHPAGMGTPPSGGPDAKCLPGRRSGAGGGWT